MIDKNIISGKIAKTVFEEMWNTGHSPAEIVKAKGLVQISDEGAIVAIVQEVARQHKKELIDTLRHLVAQQRKVKHGDNHAFLLLDDALHRMIALYAGRDFAWRVIDSAKAQMDRFRFLSYDIASPMSELIDDHAQIVDAIEAGNPEQAAHITEIHVRQVLQTLPQVARHYPDFFIE